MRGITLLWSGCHRLRAAAANTREAIALLQTRQPQQFFIKYCSTFDSTPAGNIGPTIDAALTALDEEFTVAVPALPVNGRTTYQGHHFVHQQLLSDSPLRHHPLNPMTNANLVEWLSLRFASANHCRSDCGVTVKHRRFRAGDNIA
jgi:uncharacterized protein YgbK (DUF1537 family)